MTALIVGLISAVIGAIPALIAWWAEHQKRVGIEAQLLLKLQAQQIEWETKVRNAQLAVVKEYESKRLERDKEFAVVAADPERLRGWLVQQLAASTTEQPTAASAS